VIRNLKFLLILSISCLLIATSAFSESYWLGNRFSSQQCIAIEEGRHVAKRKLCTITYEIRMVNGLYQVSGHMVFKETYVPADANEVELQVLLIDEGFVCRDELNMRSKIENRQASFSFTTEDIPTHRYVRTYFIVHYR